MGSLCSVASLQPCLRRAKSQLAFKAHLFRTSLRLVRGRAVVSSHPPLRKPSSPVSFQSMSRLERNQKTHRDRTPFRHAFFHPFEGASVWRFQRALTPKSRSVGRELFTESLDCQLILMVNSSNTPEKKRPDRFRLGFFFLARLSPNKSFICFSFNCFCC